LTQASKNIMRLQKFQP